MAKRKKMILSLGEKMLYFMAVLCIVGTFISKTFLGANVGHLKIGVEKINKEISEQEKRNESLTMQVNELTSFDNVQTIVKEMGLAYYNDNIIVID